MFYVVFVVLLFTVLVAPQDIRGVSPSDSQYYSTSKFTCRDGTKTMANQAINDDYCDCLDGSDEPGTSACSNGRFYCKNEGHVPGIIYSSRVNDGICDCCDGSDEYITPLCKNFCKEAWERSTVLTRVEVEEHQKGIQFTLQMQEKYKTDISNKNQELALSLEKKSALQPKLEDLKSKKTNTQSHLDTKIEQLKQLLSIDIEAEVQQRYDAIQTQKQIDREAEAQVQEEHHEHEHEEEHQPTEEEPVATEIPKELTEEEKQNQIASEKETIKKDLIDEKVEQNEEVILFRTEIKNLDDGIDDINKQISDLDSEISSLERFIKFDFGENGKYAYMEDQSYTYITPEYTYTLKAFKEVTQGHTRVGSWTTWSDNYSVMKYETGERCWGGPDRSMTISLACGSETQILEVKEPSKCEYSMLVKTPGACKQETLQQLLASLNKV